MAFLSSRSPKASPIACFAYSPNYTQYNVNGKLEYTARMCGAETLDAKGLGAIKVIEDQLENL